MGDFIIDIPDEPKSMADMLTDLGLSKNTTYLYSHLPTASPSTFLTDGKKAYYWGTANDGTQLHTMIEDENRFPFTFWVDPSGLRGARQGPYYRTTWGTSPDGAATHQPRTTEYPSASAKGPFPGELVAMWSARRLKWGTTATNGREQAIDNKAVHMTEDAMDQLSVENSQTILSLLTIAHNLFTKTLAERQAETDRLGRQGSGTTHQQPSSGDISATEAESHVPGERLDEEE